MKSFYLRSFCELLPNVVAGGGKVLNSEGRILFIFRNGKWDLPKGKAENKETIDQTALREVEEETGVEDLKITKPLEITYHIFKRNDKYFIKKTYWFEMFSTYTGDLKPQKNEGITKVKWVSPKKLIKVRKNIYANIEALI
jgi:8-oxo-dGTP pyrophosphatase MutT (NUDIX family)